MRNRIQTSLQQIAEQISARPQAIDYTTAEKVWIRLIAPASSTTRRYPALRFRASKFSIVAALSRLSAVTIETAESLVLGGDPDGLIVACRAARLDWSTALHHQPRPDCPPVSRRSWSRARKYLMRPRCRPHSRRFESSRLAAPPRKSRRAAAVNPEARSRAGLLPPSLFELRRDAVGGRGRRKSSNDGAATPIRP